MDIVERIIEKYYPRESKSYYILLNHSRAVARKAVEIAKKAVHIKADIGFIEEAAMLHDIGIFLTNSPRIGCHGKDPYLLHGVLGREILEQEGLPKHALVCERHIGVGITADEVKKNNLPLPLREMVPLSTEEEIICFADNFFSKSSKDLFQERNIAQVRGGLQKHGEEKVAKFNQWLDKYCL